MGANNKSVPLQFLMEAVTITLTGGLIGIISGSLVSVLISIGARFLGYDWDLVVSVFSILLAALVSIAVGVIFGLYPAVKASKLQPIDALRHE